MNPKIQIEQLKRDLESLSAEFHRNNFVGSQDINKYTRYNDRLRVPIYSSAPSTCEVGELYSNTSDGKLYHCSATNTWTAQT